MTAAIALAVVLVIAVAGASMALESQRSGQPIRPRPARPVRPTRGATEPDRPRRAPRPRDRGKASVPEPDFPPPTVPPVPEPESKGPELLRTGKAAEAKVISVVDERTIGPVTRSRLVLRIEPEDGTSVEVTVRHAFPTPDARSRVKVGAGVPVRYDPADPHRVVIDLPRE
ncbi:MAG TPA: DUF3592 domain-containing protein [Acidimicrobiales bacterium]|nr:DUF3592 domain-containing protein [Acidimicrobiales bacterium]